MEELWYDKYMRRIWRQVVGYETYSPTNNPHPHYDCSRILKLECGHELHRKVAIPIPSRAVCWECESLMEVDK